MDIAGGAPDNIEKGVIFLKYDFASIEPKWQQRWEEAKVYSASSNSDKPKFFGLVEFPYPSGISIFLNMLRPVL